MNKIVINGGTFDILKNNDIDIEVSNGLINKIKIKTNKNTKLEIVFDNIDESKYEFEYDILENTKLDIVEIKKNNKVKILSKYNVDTKGILNIVKINDIISINERNIINLNGVNSKFNCILKTVSNNHEKYDFIINHNNKNTISDLTTHGVNISGNILFNVTTYISKGNSGSIANQNNRIINLCDNECTIKPNLLIDEYDVVANHSALIGSFTFDEIFYMERLGINKNDATKLLIEGFLKSKINKNQANYFKKYWR